MAIYTPAIRTRRDLRTLGRQPRQPVTARTVDAQCRALRAERQRCARERAQGLRRLANLDARGAALAAEQRRLGRVRSALTGVPRYGVTG